MGTNYSINSVIHKQGRQTPINEYLLNILYVFGNFDCWLRRNYKAKKLCG